MEVLFHFFFECFRVTALTLLYGTLLWLVIRIIKGKSFNRLRQYLVLLVIVFVLLVINRNMPWRDEGLGDYCKVPLGGAYSLGITNCADEQASVAKGDDHEGLHVDALYTQDHKIFAHINADGFGADDTMEYVVLILSSDSIQKLKDESTFRRESGDVSKLKKPMQLFDAYWSKWRFLY